VPWWRDGVYAFLAVAAPFARPAHAGIWDVRARRREYTSDTAVRKVLAALIFLMFANDATTIYSQSMFAPFTWVEGIFFTPLPIKIRLFDIIMVIALVKGAKGLRVKPMKSTLLLAAGTLVFWFVLGILRGGDSRAALWQIYLPLAGIVAAFAFAATFTKAADFRLLAKAFVAAAIFRAVMCVVYYFAFVQTSGKEPPPHITTHDDSVLWVIAMIILIVNFLEDRKLAAKAGVFLVLPTIILAVQFNSRRMAWLSLAGSLVALYFLVPESPAKRKLRRIARVLVPVLTIYVIAGWGKTTGIFKPVGSISSVSDAQDTSTLARNAENLGLIATASFNLATGTGWGHKYFELTHQYSIADAFELWPYIPHNSVLGLLAFTGFLGFMGFWMMMPTSVYLLARVARLAKDPRTRNVGVVGVAAMYVCLNQMFGDMGIFSRQTIYTLAICFAAAMRVPVEAGVWTAPPAPPLPEGNGVSTENAAAAAG
jgi:hypothetical protein